MAELEDDILRACLEEAVHILDLLRADVYGALDLGRVAALLATPFIQHLALVAVVFGWPEGVPHVGVLRGQAQCDLSPPPPIRMGILPTGGGFSLARRLLIRGRLSPSALSLVATVPNSYPYSR